MNRADNDSEPSLQSAFEEWDEQPKESAPKNILVLGNGFDLCLEKRTSFGDFLTCIYLVCLLSVYEDLTLRLKDFYKTPPEDEGDINSSYFASQSELFEKFNYQELARKVKTRFLEISRQKGILKQEADRAARLADHIDIALKSCDYLLEKSAKSVTLKEAVNAEFRLVDNLFWQDFLLMILAHSDHASEFITVFNTGMNHQLKLLVRNSEHTEDIAVIEFYRLASRTAVTPNRLVANFCEDTKKFDRLVRDITTGDPGSDNLLIRKGFLSGWLDVERFIEAETTQNESLLSHFFWQQKPRDPALSLYPERNLEFESALIPKLEFAAKAYQAGIKDFNRLFAAFLQLQEPAAGDREKYIASKKDILKAEEGLYLEDVRRRSRQVVNEINLSEARYDYVIDFNYTRSSDLIFNPDHKDGVVFHVHGRASENNLVLGYSRDPQKYQVEKFCYPFEKKFLRVINNTEIPPYAELTAQPFKLTIFGHSCSEADSYILKQLLTDSNLVHALVLCYSEDALISACNNLTAIVGEAVMDELLSESGGQRRLYFAIRHAE